LSVLPKKSLLPVIPRIQGENQHAARNRRFYDPSDSLDRYGCLRLERCTAALIDYGGDLTIALNQQALSNNPLYAPAHNFQPSHINRKRRGAR
jgi:hypothetical protein